MDKYHSEVSPWKSWGATFTSCCQKDCRFATQIFKYIPKILVYFLLPRKELTLKRRNNALDNSQGADEPLRNSLHSQSMTTANNGTQFGVQTVHPC